MGAQGATIDVLERSREIAAYQSDPGLHGRPVSLMVAGTLLAVLAAVLCFALARAIWYEGSVPSSSGLFGVSLLFCLYVAGAYVFALAYELYDVPRAPRLTIILALLGLFALAFMVVALAALAFVKTGAGLALGRHHARQAAVSLTYLGGDDEQGPARAEPLPHFSLITCKSCERQFFPVPPDAVCPWCDTAYLSA